jgi:hypothetical protein
MHSVHLCCTSYLYIYPVHGKDFRMLNVQNVLGMRNLVYIIGHDEYNMTYTNTRTRT